MPARKYDGISDLLQVNYVNPTMHRTLNIIAAVGLAVGAVFGFAGTVVTQPHLQATLWGIDSVGLVIATSLLTLKFLRKGNDFVAAGFLVFAIGESVILSGTAAGLVESVPSFAAGTALWATALLLISIPNEFAVAVRLIGIATSLYCLPLRLQEFIGGGTVIADLIAATILRVPLPYHYFHRLDLDLVERK